MSEDAFRQLEITITSSSWTAPLPTKTIGCSTGTRRPYGKLRRCRRRRSGLPARQITTLFAILSAANLYYGSLQSFAASQQNQGSDPEDKGGAGVLQQGHRGEGLEEVEAQDLVCC